MFAFTNVKGFEKKRKKKKAGLNWPRREAINLNLGVENVAG